MNNVVAYMAYAKKAIIQVLTLVITIGTALLTFSELPDKYAGVITSVVAAAGSILHYAAANAEKPGDGVAKIPFDPTNDIDVDIAQEPEAFPEPGTFEISEPPQFPTPDDHVENARLASTPSN